MYPLLLIRYGELSLKGRNRRTFENILLNNIRAGLAHLPHGRITKTFGRIYLETENNWRELADELQTVFGIVSVSPVLRRELDLDEIKAGAAAVVAETPGATFKVETRRPNKAFSLTSPELSRTLGGYLLNTFSHLTVDVHEPDFVLNVEIRREGGALLYSQTVPPCPGGACPPVLPARGSYFFPGGHRQPGGGLFNHETRCEY